MAVERAGAKDRWLNKLNRIIALICDCGLVLVIPLSLLLFAQWPLRDVVHAYSREANDLAQWLFALYVSLAITYATRGRTHLAADALARRYSPVTRERLYRIASAAVLVPWSGFMLYAVAPIVWQSVLQLERFPETYNPGYFILKLAVALLALLVLLQAIIAAMRPESG